VSSVSIGCNKNVANLNIKTMYQATTPLYYIRMRDSGLTANQGFAFKNDSEAAVPAPNNAPPATSVG